MAEEKDEFERKIARALRKFWGEQLDELRQELGDPPREENIKPGFWDRWETALAALLYLYLKDMSFDAVESVWSMPGVGGEITAVLQNAGHLAEVHTQELVRQLTQTTMNLLRASLGRFYRIGGLTIEDLKRELEESAFSDARAENVAITETTWAFASGLWLAQQELAHQGQELQLVWRTAEDELVCNLCAPNNGQSIERLGEAPPRHPRCRCFEELVWKPL